MVKEKGRTLRCKVKITRLLAVVLSLFSFATWAEKIQLVDQHAQPVADALVSIDKPVTVFMPKVPAILTHQQQIFSPTIQVISKGQAVRFIQSDELTHYIQVIESSHTLSVHLEPNKAPPLLFFQQPGIVRVRCLKHSDAKGYIYVSEQESAAITNLEGLVDIRFTGELIKVWHPNMLKAGNTPKKVKLSANANNISTAQIQIEPPQKN